MATYYVDDGGDGTTGASWATAYTSLSALDDAVALASGDIVYIGHDHVCQYTHAASRTITGPASGTPCVIISATQGSSPPTYAKSSTNQVDTSEGAYGLTFDGSFAIYGVRMKSGGAITLASDANELMTLESCTLAPGANERIFVGATSTSTVFRDLTVDLTADGTTNRSQNVFATTATQHRTEINGMTFINAAYRTGAVVAGSGVFRVSGADFSGFTNATPCEIVGVSNQGQFVLHNCKMAATWALSSGTITQDGSEVFLTNSEDVDSPAYMVHRNNLGDCETRSDLYRSSGAEVESDTCSWQINTTATADEAAPYLTPWMYVYVATTGSKTFTVYVTHDTNPGADADFTDAQMWLEVEVMGDAGGSPLSTFATDKRTITATAAAQTDDTSSTWNGSGPSFTYKQSLAVTATVQQAGLARCRVAIAVPSLVDADYVLIDPLVTVS